MWRSVLALDINGLSNGQIERQFRAADLHNRDRSLLEQANGRPGYQPELTQVLQARRPIIAQAGCEPNDSPTSQPSRTPADSSDASTSRA